MLNTFRAEALAFLAIYYIVYMFSTYGMWSPWRRHLRLAEMGSLIGTGKKAVWVKEVRKLTTSCHQTSLISTAYALPHKDLAARMFSRWCQENFFGYMMDHFAIDLLTEYGTKDLPAHQEVINPTWRQLTKLKNSIQNKLRYRQARFGEMTIHPKIEEDTKRYQA